MRFRAPLLGLLFGLLLVGVLGAAVEGALRLSDVGEAEAAYDPFAGFSSTIPAFARDVDDAGVEIYRVASTRAGRRTEQAMTSPARRFLAEKPANGFRVFVVGGSSAAGVPYGAVHAFPARLEELLQQALPQRDVEVVNAAFSGFASRRALGVVRELGGYEPDLLIVYSGHNEFAESRYYKHLLDLDPRVFRLWEAAAQLRIYQLLTRALPVPSPGDDAPTLDLEADETRAVQMFAVAGERAAEDTGASERDAAYRELHYRHNLREMVEAMHAAGARVLLVSLGQNLSDWPPGASAHAPGTSDEDRARFEVALREGGLEGAGRAVLISPEHAQAHFVLGQALREAGRLEEARDHLQRASDLDRVPHGAPGRFNAVLAEVAAERADGFVDAAAALREASGPVLIGNDLFLDMVHPSLEGHHEIARAIIAVLREQGWPEDARFDGREALPDAAELRAADPHLRFLEQQVLLVACRLARRDDCARAAGAAMRSMEPGNPVTAVLLGPLAEQGDL